MPTFYVRHMPGLLEFWERCDCVLSPPPLAFPPPRARRIFFVIGKSSSVEIIMGNYSRREQVNNLNDETTN